MIASALFLLACSGDEAPAHATAAKTDAPAAAASNVIQIKGSDSEVNLVQRLAEEFMKGHPEVSISVTGGGSGTGIAALLEGTAQVANSSRDLSGMEKIDGGRKGLDIKAFVFATDGVAVIVNEASALVQLTMPQLASLFGGQVTTWDSLGGAGPVSLYGRQSSSGTYDYFKKAAVGAEYAASLKQMNGNAQIVEGVRSDTGAVGYVAAGYLRGENGAGVKPLPLAPADGQPAVSPVDEAAVLSGAYPLARPLYQFINGAPSGALRDFLAYEASPEGQAIVKEMGFYPIDAKSQAANTALVGGH
jgi:phosphate transport system substrate-binding protein